jgi:hypothetical protein
MGARYFSGSRAISSERVAAAPDGGQSGATSHAGPRASASQNSCRRRRAASDLALVATRCATLSSQPPSETFTERECTLRASTRNVAWNASSAACSSWWTPPADAEDHRPVSLNQCLEGQLSAALESRSDPARSSKTVSRKTTGDPHQCVPPSHDGEGFPNEERR